MKECRKCHQVKSLTEFYGNPSTKDKLSSQCKLCAKQYQKDRHEVSSGRKYELQFVNYLIHHGIYATLGRNSAPHKWVDVVAWGCVKIELKTSCATGYSQQHSFCFNNNQRNNMSSDLIVLETRYMDNVKYHFFVPSHPIFFDDFHHRKATVAYTANPSRLIMHGNPMMQAFEQAHNRLELVERVRAKYTGSSVSQVRMLPAKKIDVIPTRQLRLFGSA